MFDQVYLWVQNLAFYMVMVTAVMHVIPNPEYKRYIRFFTGMVLVVMLTAPLLKFLGIGDSWQNLYHSREYQEQVKKMEEAIRSFEEVDIGRILPGIGDRRFGRYRRRRCDWRGRDSGRKVTAGKD